VPVRRLGVHKMLRGDRTRTAEPDWPKRCPIPYGIKLYNRTGGQLAVKGLLLGIWLSILSPIPLWGGGG